MSIEPLDARVEARVSMSLDREIDREGQLTGWPVRRHLPALVPVLAVRASIGAPAEPDASIGSRVLYVLAVIRANRRR
jgi:hypothetical protein